MEFAAKSECLKWNSWLLVERCWRPLICKNVSQACDQHPSKRYSHERFRGRIQAEYAVFRILYGGVRGSYLIMQGSRGWWTIQPLNECDHHDIAPVRPAHFPAVLRGNHFGKDLVLKKKIQICIVSASDTYSWTLSSWQRHSRASCTGAVLAHHLFFPKGSWDFVLFRICSCDSLCSSVGGVVQLIALCFSRSVSPVSDEQWR